MRYDLEERVEAFGEQVISFCQKVPLTPVTKALVEQLVRAGTSIGANYFEANGSSSKRDFINKIHICKKESLETQHWLRMIAKSHVESTDTCRKLWQEAKELGMIFSSISTSAKRNLNKPI